VCCLGFIGLRLNTTKEEMLRALVESIGFSMMKLVDVYMSETGNHLDQVAVDGGVSRNDFIVQMMADLTGVSLLRPGNVEVSAWGVAGLAGLGAGVWQDREQLGRLRGEKVDTFIRRKEWDNIKDYNKWVEACKRFTKWNTQ